MRRYGEREGGVKERITMTTEREKERECEREWWGGGEKGKLRTRLVIINNNIGQYTEIPIFFSRVENTIYYFYISPNIPWKGRGALDRTVRAYTFIEIVEVTMKALRGRKSPPQAFEERATGVSGLRFVFV